LARGWWVFPATALGVITLTVLVAREHAKEARTANGFPPEDIEAAKLELLPYRESGLIFSWESDESTVSVTRALWAKLSEDVQRDLGQAMAVAKNQKQVRIRDGATGSMIAICTAAGRCRKPAIESRSPRDEGP
jgi:hypothetical protein